MKQTNEPFVLGVFDDEIKDSLRIKQNTQKYKDCSIEDAFADAYGIKSLTEHLFSDPCKVKVNDIIEVTLKSVAKNKTIFDAPNIKQQIDSRVDLYRYKKFRDFLPTKPLKAKVLEVTQDKIVIDPLQPLVDEWMMPAVKDPKSNYDMLNDKSVVVKSLNLVRGGYIGKVVIPTLSEFLGENVVMDAYIPGSQIVLNIERNFDRWIGESVKAFITNYTIKPGTQEMSLICSAKSYLEFQGNKNKVMLFKKYTEDEEWWREFTKKDYPGVVTGVINSAKKCGAFIEIPSLNITGMVTMKPEELTSYKPDMPVTVHIASFDEQFFYNSMVDQKQHQIPYVIENNILRECNLKPVLSM